MHKYLVLILGVVVAGIVGLSSWQAAAPADNTIGAAGIGDPYFPDLGNGGYDAQHFVIDLDASVANKTIRGTVTMTARATQNLTQFNLDFLGFTIHSLQVNGTNAHYRRENRELIITAPQMLKQGDTFTVTVTYSGNPDENRKNASRPFSTGWASYSGGVYVASEPDGASLWYPVNDHPLDKATYRFIITVEKPYIVAANGLLQETRDEGNFYTFVWETRDPTASYLVTVNISKFDRVEEEGDLVPIRNFFPSGQAVQGQLAFQETEAMINFYSAAFGAYPFEVYGAVVADTQLPFALETQTLSLFGKNVITGNREYSEIIIAHELAHQWWGNSISVHSWRDIWLNEGFATYTSALWVEHRHGKEAFEKLMENWYSLISSPIFRANAAIVGDPTPTKLFDMAVYYRGAWALHALRLKIGDAAFFKVLKTYYEQHKQGNAQIADFIRVAEQVSGQKLGDFFQVWLYQKELPAR